MLAKFLDRSDGTVAVEAPEQSTTRASTQPLKEIAYEGNGMRDRWEEEDYDYDYGLAARADKIIQRMVSAVIIGSAS